MYDTNGGGTNERWERFNSSRHSEYVECELDNGIHGNGTSGSVYAQNNDTSNLWSSDANDAVAWGASPTDQRYTVYQANYVNWYYGTTTSTPKIDIVKDVTTNLVSGINGVNVGLMRFNVNNGGTIINAIDDIATNRSTLVSAIAGLAADDWTPLSEVLYEAGLYYRGAAIDYGNVAPSPYATANARAGASGTPEYNQYESPIEFACQKNFIVFLSDGMPFGDGDADSEITGQPGFTAATGSGSCAGGNCLDEAAEYLYNRDLIDDTVLADQQNVVTYTIGFDIDLPLLEDAAIAGGGEYFRANDTASLTTVLTNIVTSILDTQTTFSAPAVSVNSFNRTRNLNDLFVAVFRPDGTVHWPGNLKKYRLDPANNEIVDADGVSAVDAATGFFTDTSRSFWNVAADGSDVTAGGAASKLPDPTVRNVYTYLGISNNLTAGSNAVSTSNGLIDDVVLGIGNPGDPSVTQVINFARGVDVNDYDGDGDTSEARNQMGDPLHAQPVTVIYGGTTASPDLDDAAVFFATNDGYMHAVDPATGEELWSFIPPDFLPDLAALYDNEATSNKHYGVDGNPVLQIVGDNDGIIETGEKVYLYFGMRRGGSFYYGLDVTNKTSPQYLWRLDTGTLPSAGQSWSTPVPTKVTVGSGAGQNPDRLTLVIGGGYDTDQDGTTTVTDNVGNAIYFVDSVSGNLLWHAADSGSNRDLTAMQYSIPGDIKVIDLDSDGFADRMYAADMGGQVWRFDILNGQPVNGLVNGGVIAQLGAAPSGTPTAADSRRFYYSPDVSLVTTAGPTYIHVGIGSGHRAGPNGTSTQDSFFALRDHLPFTARSQIGYDALASSPIVVSDLIDVTDDLTTVVPEGSAGWKLELRTGGWSGEKVLAEARTFNNQVYFTTFTPGVAAGSSSCTPRLGTNRLYIVDVATGAPVTNLDGSADTDPLTEADRFTEFNGSISSEVVFLFPSPDDPSTCVGSECTPPPVACVDLFCFPPGFANDPVRTFWSQENTY